MDFVEFFSSDSDSAPDFSRIDPLPTSEVFIDFLKGRTLDDSVYVRKNALMVRVNEIIYFSINILFRVSILGPRKCNGVLI